MLFSPAFSGTLFLQSFVLADVTCLLQCVLQGAGWTLANSCVTPDSYSGTQLEAQAILYQSTLTSNF